MPEVSELYYDRMSGSLRTSLDIHGKPLIRKINMSRTVRRRVLSSVHRMLSVRDIFIPGSVFLRVRIAVGGNGVRPNGIQAPTSFRVSSCARNISLHLNYVRGCSGKLPNTPRRTTIIKICGVITKYFIIDRMINRDFFT